ncbi:UNVERIFIED_ORG: hypothetical protein HNP28_000718 [Comamonas terrigena]
MQDLRMEFIDHFNAGNNIVRQGIGDTEQGAQLEYGTEGNHQHQADKRGKGTDQFGRYFHTFLQMACQLGWLKKDISRHYCEIAS